MTPQTESVPRTMIIQVPIEIPEFPTDLPVEDGVPLESDWHRDEMNLLIEIARYRYRDRHDFFAGGNMFIHFSLEHIRKKDFRGPDFFFVWGVDGDKDRDYWAVWEEDGKYPNAIIELLSRSTATVDRTTKKTVYEQTFRTPEYFLYDPASRQLEGFGRISGKYVPMQPDQHGWLRSEQMQMFLGKWDGVFHSHQRTWLRFYDTEGNLVPTIAEDQARRAEAEKRRAEQENRRADEEKRRADEEKRRADDEKQRADRAVAELAQLRAKAAKDEPARQRQRRPNRRNGGKP